MAGFLLQTRDLGEPGASVLRTFAGKGLIRHSPKMAGAACLHLFHRPGEDPAPAPCGGDTLFAFGAPAYRALPPREGLEALALDLANDAVDKQALHGMYVLVRIGPGGARLYADPSGLASVFSNRDGTLFSDSLLALCAALPGSPSVNAEALTEQVLTGVVLGGETLFEGIRRLTPPASRSPVAPLPDPSPADGPRWRDFNACVDGQLETLRAWARNAAPAAAGGASLGLSGGYDSRLLLALVLEAGWPVRLHTYSSPAHGGEEAVAERLAEAAGLPLERLAVRDWRALDDADLDRNITDAVPFWDGRGNRTMGTFNDVHTRRLRARALNGAALSLNGLGGELYRNREHIAPGPLPFRPWARAHVLGPAASASFADPRSEARFWERWEAKTAAVLGLPDMRSFDFLQTRRWYREVWLPYHAGPKRDAEALLAPTAIPFAESRVSAAALSATPWLGTSGRLQAEMIRRLHPGLARVPSLYGHPLDRVPARLLLMHRLRSLAPASWEERWRRMRFPPRPAPPLGAKLSAALDALHGYGLPLRWDRLLSSPSDLDRCLFIGRSLLRVQDPSRS